MWLTGGVRACVCVCVFVCVYVYVSRGHRDEKSYTLQFFFAAGGYAPRFPPADGSSGGPMYGGPGPFGGPGQY
jgi:hypothetical protein